MTRNDRAASRPVNRVPAIVLVVLALALAACSDPTATGGDGGPAGGDGGGGEAVTMARATWDTGWFQAEVYRQLLGELGYEVSDPADATRDANGFYPALARGEFDLWANGWSPLHEPYLEGELFTGATYDTAITFVGQQVADGARQGYLVDAATADELGLTSMSDLADASVAETFDDDGDGLADLLGCNDGWGCNLTISEHLEQLDWGANVEQVVGDYPDLFEQAIADVEAGEPTLFYTWTPNWTVAELVPGEDVVWLESPSLPDVDQTEVEGLEGCAGDADPCDLGWQINDIQVAANTDFLDEHPDVRALLEEVQIPLDDIAAQNDEMYQAAEYTTEDLEAAAETWISDNRDAVDSWLEAARS
ncbi:glycine betaine/L-proline ABC transporter substrate-binding protein ProX [Salsipaludibacter albus]|uniref:glycine betaine/L-proline ABC transporter substrate-binding protein ProX n=1 Tax=Salsipaludibacter albus TaxID=2849650 RepID=UPI001EE436D3|nr:glycine betaine/L-proline ABC transporter substrate-binding protein ProX [Salsipaludibacter albus]MBY5163757.1 glycine betaine/L-proline ABC transporter substrate-binding protein ProX [Salsipaludibacter albus]